MDNIRKVQFTAFVMCAACIFVLFAGCKKASNTTESIASTGEAANSTAATTVPATVSERAYFTEEDFAMVVEGETPYIELDRYLKENVEEYAKDEEEFDMYSLAYGEVVVYPLKNGKYMRVIS